MALPRVLPPGRSKTRALELGGRGYSVSVEEEEPCACLQRKRPSLGGGTRGRRACGCRPRSGSAIGSSPTEHHRRNGFWHKLLHSSWWDKMSLEPSWKIRSARYVLLLFFQEIPGAWADRASSGLPLSENFSFISHTSVWSFKFTAEDLITTHLPSPGSQTTGAKGRDNASLGHCCVPWSLLRSGTRRHLGNYC